MQMNRVNSTPAPAPESTSVNPRLKSAAHEFEASLMKEFLKPFQHDSLFSDSDGDNSDEDGSDNALLSFGSEGMAKEISERGGFGIATKILDHFQSTQQEVQDPKAVKHI